MNPSFSPRVFLATHLKAPKSFSVTSTTRSLIRVRYPSTCSVIWYLWFGRIRVLSWPIQEARGRGQDSTKHSKTASDPTFTPTNWFATLILGLTGDTREETREGRISEDVSIYLIDHKSEKSSVNMNIEWIQKWRKCKGSPLSFCHINVKSFYLLYAFHGT